MKLDDFLLAGVLVVLAGCGSGPDGPPLVAVEGTVTLDGKALGKADLMFVPQGETKGQGGVAQTNQDGRYALVSQDRKHTGAPVGEYRVIINKMVKPDGTDFVPDPNAGPMDTGGFRDLLPAAYSDMGQTTLTATVPAGGAKSIDFSLKSKGK